MSQGSTSDAAATPRPSSVRRGFAGRHFFLIGALLVLAAMVIVGALRLAGGHKAPGETGTATARGAPAAGGAAARPVQVTEAVVQSYPFTSSIEVLGVAKGRNSVTITSATAELITRVRFADGQFVRQGQVLVDLQAREQDADVVQAQETVNLARINLARWKTLFDKGIAAAATYDQYKAQYAQAQAALSAAQARRGDRVIRAPFSGVVGLSDISAGALINPGTPIVTLDDISAVRVDFDVPDRYLPSLRQGGAITAHPDAYPEQTVVGRIANFDTRIDEKTRAIKARAEFANPGGRLKPGMLMRVSIRQGGRTAPAAPEAAVQFQGQGAFVFVIAKGPDGKPRADRRDVQVGVRQGGLVEILGGLKPGEAIVADGINRVQAGQALKVGGRSDGPAQGARSTAGAPVVIGAVS